MRPASFITVLLNQMLYEGYLIDFSDLFKSIFFIVLWLLQAKLMIAENHNEKCKLFVSSYSRSTPKNGVNLSIVHSYVIMIIFHGLIPWCS